MIPFTIPADHEILNLNHVVRLKEYPIKNLASAADRGGMIEILLSTGETLRYEGQAAEIVKSEIMFCLTHHANVKSSIIAQMKQAAGGIIVPTMTAPGVN